MRGPAGWGGCMGALAMAVLGAGCLERHGPRDPELPCHVGVWACARFEPEGRACGEPSTELLEGDCAEGHAYGVFLESGEVWAVIVGINGSADRAVVTLGDVWGENRWSVVGDDLLIHHLSGWPGWAVGASYPTPLMGCSDARFDGLGERFDWLFWGDSTPSSCPRVNLEIEHYLLELVPSLEPGIPTVIPWPG